jgi:hypothetical protein
VVCGQRRGSRNGGAPASIRSCLQLHCPMGLIWGQPSARPGIEWVGPLHMFIESRPALRGLLVQQNNGGCPRVPTHAKMKICRLGVPSIWLECRVPEGFTSELHWAFHAWRLLNRVGFDHAHPYFSLAVWFQRERCEALLVVTIMEHAFSFHGEVSQQGISLKSGSED